MTHGAGSHQPVAAETQIVGAQLSERRRCPLLGFVEFSPQLEG